MPRFYFHTADGTRERDRMGTDLTDSAEARRQAIRFIGDLMSDEPALLDGGAEFRVDVTGDEDRLLFSVIACSVDAPDEDGADPR